MVRLWVFLPPPVKEIRESYIPFHLCSLAKEAELGDLIYVIDGFDCAKVTDS